MLRTTYQFPNQKTALKVCTAPHQTSERFSTPFQNRLILLFPASIAPLPPRPFGFRANTSVHNTRIAHDRNSETKGERCLEVIQDQKRESPNYLFPSCHPPLLPGASCGLFLSGGGGVTRTPPSYGSASVCLSRLSQFVPRRERGGDEIRKVEVWVWRAGERPSGGEGAGGGVFVMFSPPIASYARQWYPWDGFTRSICP